MRWNGILAVAALAAGLAAEGAAAPRGAPPLTPYGWGAVRIGMPEAEAKRRFGMVSTVADGDCHQLEFPDHPDLTGMARGGRIARLDIGGQSRLRTDRGLGIGSTEREVRRAYGSRLEVTPDDYQDPPAHYLTYWDKPGARGVLYITDPKGVVIAVYVGDETIGWTDGCG